MVWCWAALLRVVVFRGNWCFWLFKAFAYTTNGPAAYLERVEGLQPSGGLGGFAAWMMQADSLTIWIAQYLQVFV
jgi:hypothetical protein